MVTHETYLGPDGFLSPAEVRRDGAGWTDISGHPVEVGRIEKMSKSKRNTVDPQPILAAHGARRGALVHAVRQPAGARLSVVGDRNGRRGTVSVGRLWRLVTGLGDGDAAEAGLERLRHQTIAGVTEDLGALGFNKAVAKLYAFVSAIEKASDGPARRAAVDTLLRLAAPMVPHIAEEAWARLGSDGLIAIADWPVADPALLVEEEVTLVVQVNGKLRDSLVVARGLPRDEVEAAALASGKIARALDGKPVRKVIVVPDRLVKHRRVRDAGAPPRAPAADSLRPAARLWGRRRRSARSAAPLDRGRSDPGAPPGWLMRAALVDRLGATVPPVYTLQVELDDQITGFGTRRDDSVSRERRTLRARYRLGTRRAQVVLDQTTGSDAGIEVVGLRIRRNRGRGTRRWRISSPSWPTRSSPAWLGSSRRRECADAARPPAGPRPARRSRGALPRRRRLRHRGGDRAVCGPP